MVDPTGNGPGPEWRGRLGWLGKRPVMFGTIAGVLAAGAWFGIFSLFPQKRIALSVVVAIVVGIVVGVSLFAFGSGQRRGSGDS